MTNKSTSFKSGYEKVSLTSDGRLSITPNGVEGTVTTYSHEDLDQYILGRKDKDDSVEVEFLKTMLNRLEKEEMDDDSVEVDTWFDFELEQAYSGENWAVNINPDPDKEYLMVGFDEQSNVFWILPQKAGEDESELTFSYDDSQRGIKPRKSRGRKTRMSCGILSWLGGVAISKLLKWLEKRKYKKSLGFSEMLPPGELDQNGEFPFERGFNDWDKINGKKSLLLIPGTFGNDVVAFAGMARSEAAYTALYHHYNQRIICFNHYTLAESCKENVDFFIEQLEDIPKPLRFKVDVLTRSRGGLVVRHLLNQRERLEQKGIFLEIEKVFGIAPPHEGTPLGDVGKLTDYLKVYSLLVKFVPPGLGGKILSGLVGLAIAVAKSLGHLPGIQSESSNGVELAELWEDQTSYLGITWGAGISNYTPDADNDLARLGLQIADFIFVDQFFREPNDMVVPVSAANGDSNRGFHIEPGNFLAFPEGTNHLEYVLYNKKKPNVKGDPEVHRMVVEWLTGMPI